MLGVLLVALIAFGAYGYQSLAGGSVRSAAEYRERVAETRAAGERALSDLEPIPATSGGSLDETSSSCVDDFGFDDTGVIRDEPTYEWTLEFPSADAYHAAVEKLRATWTDRDLSVKRVPAPGPGESGAGLRGISTTDENGIELYLTPDWYSGEPVLRVTGGCIRHEYSYEDLGRAE
ncbi:hypothetical protein GCM10010094_86180 [Streptomyces flaveus]|uniref:Uncharacterized protein n=2 Tax=Streptomyces flaveus TaxID=66370 RepID=A0A917RJX6_9ACTN|nr:hypothetical protein GCM10010094_86180 [Streptomyces flaveus]